MTIVRVIKYEGGPELYAWKYPNNELTTRTQVIVHESQEAVLFKSGKAWDVLPPGRHTPDTANIPLLNSVLNLPFGGRSPFTAELWYVNKVSTPDVKWGTSTPIQLQDPKYNVFLPVRAHGQFGVRVEDAKKFLVKPVGTLPVFDRNTLVRFFHGLYLTKVKDAVASYLIHKQIGVMEINAYLEELSNFACEKIRPVLEEYGICLLNFFVNDISVPEDDPAVRKLKDALAKKAEMNIIGYDYRQQRSFDTLEGAAKNPGTSAGIMGAGLGLGMGLTAGESVGRGFAGIGKELRVDESEKKACPVCGAFAEKSKRFCPECGADTEKPKAAHKTVTCSGCDHKYDATVKFCPECGDRYRPCLQCGTDLAEGAVRCPQCGREAPAVCPRCKGVVPNAGANFCPECGTKLSES